MYQQYLYEGDIVGIGIRWFEKAVEKHWKSKVPPRDVLEIGGGSGEHLSYLGYVPENSYTSLDLRAPVTTEYLDSQSPQFRSRFKFVKGDAANLPFQSGTFDRVFSTCVLHHVDDVLAVLLETRRVTELDGEIAFVFPTDPGLLNRLVKKTISYKKMRKIWDVNPALCYALDHKNHVGSIIEQIKFVFRDDLLTFHYKPFYMKTWNGNLLVVAHIVKKIN